MNAVNIFGVITKIQQENKLTKQKLLDVEVPILKKNKLELIINETLKTQVTNALFYKEDKNSLQLGLHKSLDAGNNSLTKQNKGNIKNSIKKYVSHFPVSG